MAAARSPFFLLYKQHRNPSLLTDKKILPCLRGGAVGGGVCLARFLNPSLRGFEILPPLRFVRMTSTLFSVLCTLFSVLSTLCSFRFTLQPAPSPSSAR